MSAARAPIPPAVLDALRNVVGAERCIERSPDVDPYLVDFRRLYQGRSPMVLLPGSTAEIAQLVSICAQHRIGIVPHGGNTGYCGGATPDESGSQIVIAFKRLNRVRHLDSAAHTMIVESGCVLADVQRAADDAGLLFPLSLGSEGSCQIGGNLSTNAGGTAVLRYGMMRELTLGLEVVLADGTVLDGLKALRKDNSGYDLRDLFVGSEGTLGLITAACLKLFPRPLQRATAVVALTDIPMAVSLLAHLRSASADRISTFELMPRIAIELTARHIEGVRDPFERPHPWYALVELTSSAAGNDLEELLEQVLPERTIDAVLAVSEQQRAAMWRMRESIPEAQRHAGASIKHDISVPIEVMAEFVRDAGEWIGAHVPDGDLIAYGHLGDGNLHFNVQQRPGADAATFLARAAEIHTAVYERVAQYRGSFSAEHGIGRLKAPQLLRYKSAAEIAAMRALKRALDPNGILNPGKVLASVE